jgi:hypothetical protein
MIRRAGVEDQLRGDTTDGGVDHRGVDARSALDLEGDRDIDQDVDPGGRVMGRAHRDTIRRAVPRPTIREDMADRR